jgi:hypothetical protein
MGNSTSRGFTRIDADKTLSKKSAENLHVLIRVHLRLILVSRGDRITQRPQLLDLHLEDITRLQ